MAIAPTTSSEPSTREIIAKTAIRLFAENGYAGTSIRDIVEAAGVTKPVLYYYFKSKEELYRLLIHDIYNEWLPQLREHIQAPLDFHVRLRNLVDYYLDYKNEEDEDAIRFVYVAAFGPRAHSQMTEILSLEEQHMDLLKQFFQEGIDTGCIHPAPIDDIAIHFFGTMMMHINLRLASGQQIDAEKKDAILHYCLKGIGR